MTTQHRPDGREQEDGMTDLTNFTDTSDVSDAAIEWVRAASGRERHWTETEVRYHAKQGDWDDRAVVLAARLIQQHRPDLLVDPVDAIVREELAKAYEATDCPSTANRIRDGQWDGSTEFTRAKRLYLMGIEKGKGA